MKPPALLNLCTILLLLWSAGACSGVSDRGPATTADEPPLLLEEPPLLLDEPPLLLEEPGEDAPGGPLADNSRCHVCHLNYEEEKLALTHARADIGCEKCHGPSDEHCSDEDNITPPSILYSAEKINPSCRSCHEKLDPEEHEAILAGTAQEKKLCTDCHGEHRLAHRTRRWDRVTGKLIEDDSVRMMTDELLRKD